MDRTPPPPGKDWRDAAGILHIDVRGLGPPLPMVAILARLEQWTESGPIIVHHEREPIYLYPELASRGWVHCRIPGEPGEVRLKLTRHAP